MVVNRVNKFKHEGFQYLLLLLFQFLVFKSVAQGNISLLSTVYNNFKYILLCTFERKIVE